MQYLPGTAPRGGQGTVLEFMRQQDNTQIGMLKKRFLDKPKGQFFDRDRRGHAFEELSPVFILKKRP